MSPTAATQGELSVGAAVEAPSLPSVHLSPTAVQAAVLPPVSFAAPTPGPTTEETGTAQNAANAAVHAAHICTTHRHEPPLPLSCTKRQKTYVETAATPAVPPRLTVLNLPICTPLQSPNGTKGTYAGAQSLQVSPGGTQTVACYMERGGDTTAELIELQRLHFYP